MDFPITDYSVSCYANPIILQSFLKRYVLPGFSRQDQCQAQILALIELKADVYLFTGNLSDEQLEIARIKRYNDIYDLIESMRKRLGNNISICILPDEPQTIPFINEQS